VVHEEWRLGKGAGDRMLALECKSKIGRVTAAQRGWLEALSAVRWSTSAIVRPAPTLDELEVLVA